MLVTFEELEAAGLTGGQWRKSFFEKEGATAVALWELTEGASEAHFRASGDADEESGSEEDCQSRQRRRSTRSSGAPPATEAREPCRPQA